jgi:hypothetical protein
LAKREERRKRDYLPLLVLERNLFWPEPLPIIIKTLNKFRTIEQVYENLPDIEIIKPLEL